MISMHKITKPCPFKHRQSKIFNINLFDNQGYYVECVTCGARGPIRRSPASAIKAWNGKRNVETFFSIKLKKLKRNTLLKISICAITIREFSINMKNKLKDRVRIIYARMAKN